MARGHRVDGLFGHEPLSRAPRARIESYYQEALAHGRHDFCSRARVREQLAAGGWRIEIDQDLPDAELAFHGPASAEVLQAWTSRLARMQLLAAHFGEAWESFRGELLSCLASSDHRSLSRVSFILARRAWQGHPRPGR